ncbi:MAG: hypothetical protein WBQ34_02870 [Candidatus Acidiferrales bacterium]
MPTLTRAKKLGTLLAIIVALCAWFVPEFWTAWMGIGWHILHGSSFEFEGHRIEVPWDMAVSSGRTDFAIVRQMPKYAIFKPPSGIMMVTRRPGPPTDLAKNYQRISQAVQPSPGYHLLDLRKFAGVKGTIFCWEDADATASDLDIECWFDKDTLMATYRGTEAYRGTFYKVVSQLAKIR